MSTNIKTELKALVDNLSDKQATAMKILFNMGAVGASVAVAGDAAKATTAPARKPRAQQAAAPAPTQTRKPRAAAPAPVADELEDDADAGADDVTLPENPTVEDLFTFLDTVEVEPQSRKLMQTKEEVEAFGGDFKAIQAAAESDDIGARRDACEEFIAQCNALFDSLIECDAKAELKPLIDELGITVADIKEQYGDATKESIAMAIIVALNADDEGDDGIEDAVVEEAPAPAPARKPRAQQAAAPAAPTQTRRTRPAAAAPAAPAKPARGGNRRPAAVADDLGDELEDL